tara:strand:- start:1358 stop:1480 length:123 start_codon:yes stop_codon:yes gene_type:complete
MQIANWEGQFCPSFFVSSFSRAVSKNIFREKHLNKKNYEQ